MAGVDSLGYLPYLNISDSRPDWQILLIFFSDWESSCVNSGDTIFNSWILKFFVPAFAHGENGAGTGREQRDRHPRDKNGVPGISPKILNANRIGLTLRPRVRRPKLHYRSNRVCFLNSSLDARFF